MTRRSALVTATTGVVGALRSLSARIGLAVLLLPTLGGSVLLLVIATSIGSDASNEPEQSETPAFVSYSQAIDYVTHNPRFSCDEVDTSRSPFIRRARFCTDHSDHGYAILDATKAEYVYEGVPNAIWQQFRDAGSFGRFYDQNIRGLSPLRLGDAPPAATAICRDGTYTFSKSNQGQCSGDQGVAQRLQ
jgi:hypothetical protein